MSKMESSFQPEFLQNKIHPHRLALWVGIGSIIMMFGSFTSAYIVRRAAGNWLEFKLPDVFFLSTAVIVLSSITLHYSYYNFKNGKEMLYKSFLVITFFLGFLFIALQFKGYQTLDAAGVTFTANPSSSFVYLISGLHIAHVLGGIGALSMALVHAISLPFKPTEKRRLRFNLVLNYWHFVDILWVYLLVFFIVQQ